MQTSPEINELAAALAKAQGDISAAHKEQANPFYHSRYADLASVWDACRVPLAKNGLAVSQIVGDDDGRITVHTLLMHGSGQWISGRISMAPVREKKGEGYATASDPQAMGSAITYARRYALAAMVGVAPEDDDGNRASRPEEAASQTASPSAQQKEGRGSCPVHDKPFEHRVGTSKNGKSYDFWACPGKEDDGSYCQERPEDPDQGKLPMPALPAGGPALLFLDGWLERCPVHGDPWQESSTGHWHGLKPTGACQRGFSLRPHIQARMKAACAKKGWDARQLNEWIKAHADGKTWASANSGQLIEAMESLEADAIAL